MRRNYKYNIGDKVQCKDGSYNTILEKTTDNRGASAYICKCNKNHVFKKHQLKISTRCPYCINQKVEKGINDISTTNKEMFSMIKDKEFAYTHHDNSTENTYFVCPICKNDVLTSPYRFKKYGLPCIHCSDGYSYGEKFISNLLDTIHIKYIAQYSSRNEKWCEKYKYDFYLPYYDCIIEVQGLQHYIDTSWSTYKEIHENDIQKKNLAKKHVKFYIELDVRKSELNYIRRSIYRSKLDDIICLSKYEMQFSWNEVHKESIDPIINKIVDKYNNYSKDISELSNILQLSNNTIVRYLKEGALLGICDYNPVDKKNIILKRNHLMNSEIGSKPIICINDSKVFRNAKLLEKLSNELYGVSLDSRNISSVCHGKQKTSKGFSFKFITRQEFNNIKIEYPAMAFGEEFVILEDVV